MIIFIADLISLVLDIVFGWLEDVFDGLIPDIALPLPTFGMTLFNPLEPTRQGVHGPRGQAQAAAAGDRDARGAA